MNELPASCVYAVSSRRRLVPEARTTGAEVRALQLWLDEIVEAGVDVLQIREPDLPAGRLCEIVRHAVDLARGRATKIVVNDRADVGLAAHAHGLHLPGHGLPVSAVRRLDSSWIVGRSVHQSSPGVGNEGADYVLFGTVYPSRSKADPGYVVAGLEALGAFALAASCPVIAIGGMTPERARACVARGAAGVAAIGLFLPVGAEPEALGPARAVTALRQAMGCGNVGM